MSCGGSAGPSRKIWHFDSAAAGDTAAAIARDAGRTAAALQRDRAALYPSNPDSVQPSAAACACVTPPFFQKRIVGFSQSLVANLTSF